MTSKHLVRALVVSAHGLNGLLLADKQTDTDQNITSLADVITTLTTPRYRWTHKRLDLNFYTKY